VNPRPAALLALLPAVGCVQAAWNLQSREEPVTGVMTAPLAPGIATFGQCLDRLGAPLYVWETSDGGFMLVYAWRNEERWGLSVSVPLWRFVSADFRYSQLNRESPSVALFFDRDERLRQLERGRLGQFAREHLVELDDDPEDH